MGALTRRIKESPIGKIFMGIKQALGMMLKEMEPSLNPAEIAELNKIEGMTGLSERAEKQFEIVEPKKDKDGFNKIPNKLAGIEAPVSEEKARTTTIRGKGGEEKTRDDED